MAIEIKELIERGRVIKKGLTYLHSPDGVIRLYDAYRLANADEYYSWKELSVRYLQLYYPADLERFVKYSEEFEKNHYIPRFISNMVGVLEACEALPSEKVIHLNDTQKRETELSKVEELDEIYRAQTTEDRVHKSGSAFHAWHAAACILFDKWFYPTDEDWIKFQDIDGDGTRVLPLIVSPCDFDDSELGEFQAINSPDRTLADMCDNEAAVERVYLELNKEIKNFLL